MGHTLNKCVTTSTNGTHPTQMGQDQPPYRQAATAATSKQTAPTTLAVLGSSPQHRPTNPMQQIHDAISISMTTIPVFWEEREGGREREKEGGRGRGKKGRGRGKKGKGRGKGGREGEGGRGGREEERRKRRRGK